MIIILVQIFVLIFIFSINRVKKTRNLFEIYENSIQKEHPTAVSFSLGYQESSKKYKNVYVAEDGNVPERSVEVLKSYKSDKIIYVLDEEFPVDFDGRRILNVLQHGTVIDLENGFRIEGFGSGDLKCPVGYETQLCVLRSVCSDQEFEAGAEKLVNLDLFNALKLYRYESPRQHIRSKRSIAQFHYHPRMKLRCLEDRKYELLFCPDTKLIDPITKSCTAYDICGDKIDGFRHRHLISLVDVPLKDTEYYICINNKSVRSDCGISAIFNDSQNACVPKSPCIGLGNQKLLLNNKQYIDCRNDNGKIVYCENGIKFRSGTTEVIACQKNACRPGVWEFENSIYKYNYQAVSCEKDVETIILCDKTEIADAFTLHYGWGEDFDIKLPGCPKKVLDSDNVRCVSPDRSIIKEGCRVKIKWSKAMRGEHFFDVLNQKFTCEEYPNTNYIRDYRTNQIIPTPPGDQFVDSASPCQDTAFQFNDFPIFRLYNSTWSRLNQRRTGKHISLPKNNTDGTTTAAPIIHIVTFNTDDCSPSWKKKKHIFWPRYDRELKVYVCSIVSIKTDVKKNASYLLVKDFEDAQVPFGFAPVGNTQKKRKGTKSIEKGRYKLLNLIGYKHALQHIRTEKVDVHTCAFNFICTGRTERIRFSRTAKLVRSIQYTHKGTK